MPEFSTHPPDVIRRLCVKSLRCAAAALLFGLSACSTIPNGGPSTTDVLTHAGSNASPHYELVDINSHTIGVLKQHGPASFYALFGNYHPADEPRIDVGDTISVTLWDRSETAAAGPVSLASAKTTVIPDQTVRADGTITIPYCGRIHIAGRTPERAERIIQRALATASDKPQVTLRVTDAPGNVVTVTGEVGKSGEVPLNQKAERIMDVIAQAGGDRAPINQTDVQLLRGATTARVPMLKIASDPRENVYLRPKDVMTLVLDQQSFVAIGATGKEAVIPFEDAQISLAQALAKAGGLDDIRSDAAGVFIFRYEPPSIARALRPDSPLLQSGGPVPFAYRLNMRDPNSLFLSQNFYVRNKDVLYVSNAPLVDFEKAMGAVSMVVAPAVSGISLCAAFAC